MKKILISTFLSLLFLNVTPVWAGNQLLKNGQLINQENAKTGDKINAMTTLISNYSQFKHEWDNTSFEYKPTAKLAEKAKVGDTVHLVTFFSNCLPDESNKCNLSFKVRILKDDAIILDSPKTDYRISYPGENSLQLSNVVVGSKFESNETGKYTYEVTVTDENSDDSVLLKTYLNVTAK